MTDGYGYLSRHEQEELGKKLEGIAGWLGEALDDTIIRRTAIIAGPSVSKPKRKETPLPYNETVSGVAHDLHSTLTAWIEYVCTERSYLWPGNLRTRAAAQWLHTNIVGLALTDEARTAADEIHHAYTRTIKAVDRPLIRTYQGRCQVCGTGMWARRNDKKIACKQCAAVIDRQANDHRILNLLEEQSFTVNELVDILADRFGVQVKTKTIHDMAYRKTNPIVVKGETFDGQKLYRAGDVFYNLRQRKVIA
ncbi:helix-turn-helix DNA binding domain protein [Gordonia phage Denise]|uniref:Helix-turn-helix DNA binding domain protein n=1 Tax=Gordonia phage Denise TaxID=2652879 RepID=A0A5P8DCG3_9CAUD|nr:helix-turn-helix DNA binding domain protein [Gordonia phage Denise]QFP96686.1 helix-turn-helix DNA binding domain protein [Gordonia phage Denise]